MLKLVGVYVLGLLFPGVCSLVLKALNNVKATVELVDKIPEVVASISRGASKFESPPGKMQTLVAES